MGAGCHNIFLIPYHESSRSAPAVIGLMDISARPFVDPDILSLTVPWPLFLEMEANIPGSFLDKEAWHKVAARLPKEATCRSRRPPLPDT